MSALKNEYAETMSLNDAIKLALKTLTKAMDTTSPTSEKVRYGVWLLTDAVAVVVDDHAGDDSSR